jgi:uncharacterized membrane protein
MHKSQAVYNRSAPPVGVQLVGAVVTALLVLVACLSVVTPLGKGDSLKAAVAIYWHFLGALGFVVTLRYCLRLTMKGE